MQGVAVELLASEWKSDLPAIRSSPGPILRPRGGRVANEVDPTRMEALNLIERSLNLVRRQEALDDGVTVLAIVTDVLFRDGHNASSARAARTLVHEQRQAGHMTSMSASTEAHSESGAAVPARAGQAPSSSRPSASGVFPWAEADPKEKSVAARMARHLA